MNWLTLAGGVLIWFAVIYAAVVGGLSWCARRMDYQRQRESTALRREVNHIVAKQDRKLAAQGINVVRHGEMLVRHDPRREMAWRGQASERRGQ